MENIEIVVSEWPCVLDLMPDDLEQSATDKLAIRRRREITSGGDLLRLALCYGFCDLTLEQTALQAALIGMGEMSDVAVLKRLRQADEWLGHLVLRFLQERGLCRDVPPLSVRIVDATVVSEPGSRGTDWRVHVGLDLSRQQITTVELTGSEGGETLRRHDVAPGEVILADGGYGQREGVAHILDQEGHVVVRINWQNFPLQTRGGRPLDIVRCLETLRPGEIGDWPVQFEAHDRVYAVRLLALRKSRAAAERAQKRIRHEASRKGRKPDRRSLRAAGFVYVITDLLPETLPADQGLELYRLRWQIEIVFKRLKSLLHLDHLRAKDPGLARSCLYAKILGALIVEELCEGALAFFPWGYPLFPGTRQSLALAAELR
jgi:hypothetical protein